MTIIQTDQWFKNNNYDINVVVDRISIKNATKREIKSILLDNGLNSSSENGKMLIKRLQEKEVWSLIKRYYRKYQRHWHGPQIPIYILPVDIRNRSIMLDNNGKSGVAFPDALFLFLSDQPTEEEMEALFVHEYHHVCRFNSIQNQIKDFTLLDSIIMEGLAEHAVLDYCGKNYITKWNRVYSNEELKKWWKGWFVPNLSTKKEKNLHNSLLFGRKFFPTMVGYSIGFFLISEFRKKQNFSTKTFIGEPATTFLLQLD